MAAVTAATAGGSERALSAACSGALLALGAAALFIGTLFYARLTPELGLPALPDERVQALADTLSLGPQRLALAGGFAFVGDCLMLAACIALASSNRGAASDLERAGWSLMAVSVALAMVFDSMTAALFWPLAHGSDPAPFLAAKAWFDFMFAAGNVPFGVGFIAVLWADAGRDSPLLPKPLAYAGFALGAAAAVSGLGYVTNAWRLPLVIGLTVTFGCVVLTVLGVQLVRRGASAVAGVGDPGRRSA
jgi:hypothetical protein